MSNNDPVQFEFVYPSIKEQTKQAFVGTAIGLVPVAVMIGGLAAWSKISEWREAKKNALEVVEPTPEEPTE